MEKKKLRVAFLSRFQGNVERGVETFVSELTERLSKDHTVEILSGKNADSLGRVIAGKYDVVVPTNGRLQALKISFGRLFSGYKMLISGHAGIGKDDIWNILTRPNVFVALTDFARDWAKKWAFGVKIVKIPNGIDLSKFKPSGEKFKADLRGPIVLSVGALTWYKHHERTIEAVARLPEVSLLIVGKGEKKENLEKLVNQKIPGRFKIINVSYKKMPSIYRTADLFVLPSWEREAFGIVYLEAMASGLPIVAPDDSQRREIIGEAGVFTNTSNPEEYAEAIKKALSKNWGELPRLQAEKFSWDNVADEYKKLLEDIA